MLPAGNHSRSLLASLAGRSGRSQAGFTYLLILAALIIVGILAEVGVSLTSRVMQANKEAELLFRGQAYANAIKSYYYARPTRAYPRSLEVLLSDPRFQHKRHIRHLYAEPFTEEGRWLLLKNSRGEITGVTSASQQIPLKQANFSEALKHLAGASSYREWIFEFRPKPPKKMRK